MGAEDSLPVGRFKSRVLSYHSKTTGETGDHFALMEGTLAMIIAAVVTEVCDSGPSFVPTVGFINGFG